MLCCIALLAPLVVTTPQTRAASSDLQQKLVVIFVENSLFSGSVDNENNVAGKINRYARDVQNALPQTKALILPLPQGANAGQMFSVLEKLYAEGQKRENRLFRLSGAVFVGETPLPVIRTTAEDVVSLFPLTDFEDPAFLWDEENEVFEKNGDSSLLQAEIFHGVIRAPKDAEKTEAEWLGDFFDKNHAYHSGETEKPEQKLLMADFIEEASSIQASKEMMYEISENELAADIAFYRYNNTLLKDIEDLQSQSNAKEIDFSIAISEGNTEKQMFQDSLTEWNDKWNARSGSFSDSFGDTIAAPDSVTFDQIHQLLPNYMQVTDRYMGEVDEKIEGSGRWIAQEERADMIPTLISKMDTQSREFLREFSTDIEEDIVDFVNENWQKPVTMIDAIYANKIDFYGEGDISSVENLEPYFHGKPTSEITNVEECSLLRGSFLEEGGQLGDSSQLVEFNHVFNKNPQGEDSEMYQKECKEYAKCCVRYFAEPAQCEPEKAIWDVFDLKGGMLQKEGEEASFQNCLQTTIPQVKSYSLPQVSPFSFYGIQWEGNPRVPLPIWDDDETDVSDRVIGHSPFNVWDLQPYIILKKIPSTFVHNEPRPETISGIISDIMSGAIPADDVRRVTFQDNGNQLRTVEFPDLFALEKAPIHATHEEMEIFAIEKIQEKENELRGQMMQSNFESYLSYLNTRRYGLEREGSRLIPSESLIALLSSHEYLQELTTPIVDEERPGTVVSRNNIPSVLGSISDETKEKIKEVIEKEKPFTRAKKAVDEIVQNTFPDTETLLQAWEKYAENPTEEMHSNIENAVKDLYEFDGDFYLGKNNGVGKWDIGTVPTYSEFLQNDGDTLLRPNYEKTILYTREDAQAEERYPYNYFDVTRKREEQYPYKPPYILPIEDESGFGFDVTTGEAISFDIVDIPKKGFLTGENGETIKDTGGSALAEFLRWRSLSTDEKHKRIMELYFSGELENVLKKESNYELSIIRAHGNNEEFWWKRDPGQYLPGDDMEWERAQETQLEEEVVTEEPEEGEVEEKCGIRDEHGVSIFDWPTAFECWLEETIDTPLNIEMSNSCNFTAIIDPFGAEDDINFDDLLSIENPEVPDGSRIYISSSRGSNVPEGEETMVTVDFINPDGENIIGGISFDILAEDGASIIDGNDESENLYQTVYSGSFSVPVKITSDTAKVTVIADNFPQKIYHFSAIENGTVMLEELPSDDFSKKVIGVRLVGDMEETLTEYEGTATAALNNVLLAELEDKNVTVENGVAEVVVEIFASAPIELSVSVPGFTMGKIVLQGDENAFFAERLFMRNFPKAIGLGEEHIIEIVALDKNGKAEPAPATTSVIVTQASSDSAEVGYNDENEMELITKNILEVSPLGEGKFMLTGQDITGNARVIAAAAGLQSDAQEVFLVEKFGTDYVSNFSPKSTMTALLGSDFGNIANNPDAIANMLLFRGDSQAIISSAYTASEFLPEVSVNNNGGITTFGSGINAQIIDMSPLTIQIFEENKETEKAVYSLTFGSNPVIENEIEIENASGIFFQSLDTSGVLTSTQNANGLAAFFEEKKILTINNEGEIEIHDNRFSVHPKKNETNMTLEMVFEEETVVAEMLMKNPTVTLLRAQEDKLKLFSVPDNANGSRGFFIEGTDSGSFLPNGGKSLEMQGSVFAPGFNEDDNFALQIASGVPIGEAAVFSFGPSGILLGDPTIALGVDMKLVNGFDRGIGKEIHRKDIERNDFILDFRWNTDSLPEILTASYRGEIRIFENIGDLEFVEKGKIFETEENIQSLLSADFNGDARDDLLIVSDEKELFVYENTGTSFRKRDDIQMPEAVFEHILVEDFDQDGNPDLLGYEDNGDISVFWGSAGGYSSNQKTRLEGFGARVDDSNLALDNTMISSPGMLLNKADDAKIYTMDIGIYGTEEWGVETALALPDDPNAEKDTDTSDDMLDILKKIQENATDPNIFNQDFSQNTATSELQKIGIFTPIDSYSSVVVELFAKDENGGVLQKNDEATFTLRVKNGDSNGIHFSLAHMLHTALAIDTSSLTPVGEWTKDTPVLEDHGERGIRVLDIELSGGETAEFTFTTTMQEESAVTPLIRKDLGFADFPADGKPDISLILPGVNGVLHYLSGSGRTFTKYFDEAEDPELPEYLREMLEPTGVCDADNITDEDNDGDGIPNAEDGNNDCVADSFEKDLDGNGVPDFYQDSRNPYTQDTDNDGIPDVWDQMIGGEKTENNDWENMLDTIGEVNQELKTYSQCDGGCLDLPVNFAALVPGKVNTFPALVSALQGILGQAVSGGGTVQHAGEFGFEVEITQEAKNFAPAFVTEKAKALGKIVEEGAKVAGETALGIIEEFGASDIIKQVREGGGDLPEIWIEEGPMAGPVFGLTIKGGIPVPCTLNTCQEKDSFFRLYVSPTLTGAVGTAICTGPWSKKQGNTGKCMVFASSALNNKSICEEAAEKEKKQYSGAADSSDGCSLVNTNPAKAKVSTSDSGGLKGLLYDLESLGSFNVSYNTGQNKRVTNFPGSWIYEQMAEIQGMLTTIPTITVYLPNLSGLKGTDKTFTESFGKEWGETKDSVAQVITGDSDDDIEQDGVVDGAKAVATGIKDAMGDLPAIFTPKSANNSTPELSDDEKEAAAKALKEEYEKQAKKYIAAQKKLKVNLNDASGNFSELLDSISSLPFLELQKESVPIKVPYLSRASLFALRADISYWIEDAQEELDRATDNWAAGCEADLDIQEAIDGCDASQTVKEHLLWETDAALESMRKNEQILEKYIKQPSVLANLDMLMAQWLSQVICVLDTSVLYLSDWYLRNRIRLQAWEDFMDVFKSVRQSWGLVGKVFGDFESYCPSCNSTRGESVNNVFQSSFGAILALPIIRFPRLPDIVIDLSQWKGGIVIPVPQLDVHLVPITFPKIPPLQLLNSPVWEIQIPAIPTLPDLGIIPTLPPFIDVPKITLPDLPPFPTLPDLPTQMFDFMNVMRPLLVVFCLFSGANLPVDEKTELKSVIEAITSRSSTRMISFDFAGALFPDFVIPSVREIEIALEVNLDIKTGDEIVQQVKNIFKPWNETATDTRAQLEEIRNEMYLRLQDAGGGSYFDSLPAEDLFSQKSAEEELVDIFGKELLRITENSWSEHQKMYSPTQLLAKMGKEGVHMPEKLPSVEKIEKLRKSVVALQKEYIEEAKVLAKYQDITRIEGTLVGDSVLASKISDTKILVDIPRQETEIVREKPMHILAQEDFSQTFATNTNDNLVQHEGVYSQCGVGSEKVIQNDDFAKNINEILTADFDADGDDDMLLGNRSSIFIKENHKQEDVHKHFSTPPEIGNFEQFLPVHESVKNITVRGGTEKMRANFSGDFSEDLLGIAVTITDDKNGFFWEEDMAESEYYTILLLASKYIPEGNNPKEFALDSDVFVEQNHFLGNILTTELLSDSIRIPMDAGNWFVGIQEIREEGLSTPSEIHHVFVEKSEEEEAEEIGADVDANVLRINSASLKEAEEETIVLDKKYTITVRNTDSYGNFTEDFSTRIVHGPDILLNGKELYNGKVSVTTEPRVAGVPFSLFRERLGKQKRILTGSVGDNGAYETDVYGEKIIDDFSKELGAILTNRQGKVLAKIEKNKVRLVSDDVTVVASNSGKIGIIYKQTGRVLAEIVPVSDGNTDADVQFGELTVREADSFLRGTYVSDRNRNDSYHSQTLPGNAPTFAGGVALMKHDEILGMISAKGEVKMLNDTVSFRVKNTFTHDGYIILTLLDVSGRERFDIFTKTGEENLVLFQNNEEVRKYFESKDFVLKKAEDEKNKETKKNEIVTGNDILHFSQSLYSCETCTPLLPNTPVMESEKMCYQNEKFLLQEKLFSVLEKNEKNIFDTLEPYEYSSIIKNAFPESILYTEGKTGIWNAVLPFWEDEKKCTPSFPVDAYDMCPNVPEDMDGENDEDGCPEYDFSVQFSDVPEGIYVTAGYTADDITTLDYIADIRAGDGVYAAIESQEKNEMYRISPTHRVPESFDIKK